MTFMKIKIYFQIRATYPLKNGLIAVFVGHSHLWMLRHRRLFVDASAPQAELFVV